MADVSKLTDDPCTRSWLLVQYRDWRYDLVVRRARQRGGRCRALRPRHIRPAARWPRLPRGYARRERLWFVAARVPAALFTRHGRDLTRGPRAPHDWVLRWLHDVLHLQLRHHAVAGGRRGTARRRLRASQRRPLAGGYVARHRRRVRAAGHAIAGLAVQGCTGSKVSEF